MKKVSLIGFVLCLVISQAFATGNESRKEKKKAKTSTSELNAIPIIDEEIVATIPTIEEVAEVEVKETEVKSTSIKKDMSETEKAYMVFCNEITEIIDVMNTNVGDILGAKKERSTALGDREYWVSNKTTTDAESAEVYYSYVKRPNQWYLVLNMPVFDNNVKAKYKYSNFEEYLTGCLGDTWVNEEITTQFGTTNKFNKKADNTMLSKELYLTLVHDKTKVMLVISKPD